MPDATSRSPDVPSAAPNAENPVSSRQTRASPEVNTSRQELPPVTQANLTPQQSREILSGAIPPSEEPREVAAAEGEDEKKGGLRWEVDPERPGFSVLVNPETGRRISSAYTSSLKDLADGEMPRVAGAQVGDPLDDILASLEWVDEADGEGGGPRTPETYQGPEWSRSPERLPTLEEIERMETFEEVVEVMWDWHALADREPSLMWTPENEAVMDAAMEKFSSMSDLTPKDLSEGKSLVGIYQNIKRLRKEADPEFTPEVIEAYEDIAVDIRDAHRMLEALKSAEESAAAKPDFEAEKANLEQQLAGGLSDQERAPLQARLAEVTGALEAINLELSVLPPDFLNDAATHKANFEQEETNGLNKLNANPELAGIVAAREYEALTNQLKQVEEALKDAENINNHRARTTGLDTKITDLTTTLGNVKITHDAAAEGSKERQDAYERIRGLSQLIMMYEREKERLPVNFQVAQIEEQAKEARKKSGEIDQRLAELDKDATLGKDAKYDDETRKTLREGYNRDKAQLEREAVAKDQLVQVIRQKVNKEVEQKEISLLKKQKAVTEGQLKEARFKNRVELDEEYKKYSLEWESVLEGSGKKGEHEGPEIAETDRESVEKEPPKDLRSLEVITTEYQVASTILSYQNPETYLKMLYGETQDAGTKAAKLDREAVIIRRGAERPLIEAHLNQVQLESEREEAQEQLRQSTANNNTEGQAAAARKIRVVSEKIRLGEVLINNLAEEAAEQVQQAQEKLAEAEQLRRQQFGNKLIIRKYLEIPDNQDIPDMPKFDGKKIEELAEKEMESGIEEIDYYLKEAHKRGMLQKLFEEFDTHFIRLKESLAPHPSGWNRKVEPPNYDLIKKQELAEASKFLNAEETQKAVHELGLMSDWGKRTGGGEPFNRENMDYLAPLIPFLRYRFHTQTQDYIMARQLEDETRPGQGRFPEKLTNRRLVESEWSIRQADKRDRLKRGSKIVKEEMVESSGSGYYYVNATSVEEIELAIEYFVGTKLTKEIHQDPNKIFQEREKFVIALGEAAARFGLSNDIKDLMLKFEMQVFAYSAELFNKNNQLELVAQVLQVAGDYADGLGRWKLLPQLLGGDLASALFMLDRTAGSEILFRPWGPKNQFGNETHKYLMLHYIARDVVAERLMGIELKSESVDTDLLRDELMEKEFADKGYSKDYIRQKVAEVRLKAKLVEKQGGRLTEEDHRMLRLGTALERMESNVFTLDEVRRQRDGGDGVIKLTGEKGTRRNLEKLGRYQSKEDFMLLYEDASRGANLIELERKDQMGEPMSTKEIQLLDLGRIQRKLDQGARLLKLERKEREGGNLDGDEQRSLVFLRGEKARGRALAFRELKASERDTYMDWKRKKRNAVNMAIQFQSMTQQIAVRGDPSYICGNGLEGEVNREQRRRRNWEQVLPRIERQVARRVEDLMISDKLSESQAVNAAYNALSKWEQNMYWLGVYKRKVDQGGTLSEEERSFYDNRNTILDAEDIVGKKGEDILVERREGHFVAKHLSKKFIQYADNWAKIYWGEHLRIKTKGEVKGWQDPTMSDDEREGLLTDVRCMYDPFWDSKNNQEIVLVSYQQVEQQVKQSMGGDWGKQDEHQQHQAVSKRYNEVNKTAMDKIRANWRLLSAEDRLKSLVDGKGDKDLPGGGGLANDVSLSQPGRTAETKPTEAPGTRHIDHRDFWSTFTEAEREVEAAKIWQRDNQDKWKILVSGGVNKYADGKIVGKLSTHELEDLLQEARYYKRKVTRHKAIQELQANGFRATLKDPNGVEIKQKIAVKDANGKIVTEEKPIDVMFASTHPLGQFLGIDYIAQQNEIRNQLLSVKITEQARQILAGKLRWEDADPLALLRIEIDPRLELKILGGENSKNLENRMRTMVFAKCHESFYGTKRIEEELREVFHDPDNVDSRIAWHWTNEHIGSKRVVNLAEWISVYQNSLSRRMRTNIPYILQPITSMPEMFGVSPMGVMGIPMMIIRRDALEENFYQEILDSPELKSYGFSVAGSVKVRDSKITHVTEQGLPKEGTQDKPTNDADKWWEHAQEFVEVFRGVAFTTHYPHEKTIEKYFRETLGRLEQECRLNVTTIRFARTAGEEMLVEKRAIMSENGDYLLDVDTKGSITPPDVSGSRSMVNDMIYNHVLWLLSDAGRKAYSSEVPFYGQFNWRMVQWLVGKITL